MRGPRSRAWLKSAAAASPSPDQSQVRARRAYSMPSPTREAMRRSRCQRAPKPSPSASASRALDSCQRVTPDSSSPTPLAQRLAELPPPSRLDRVRHTVGIQLVTGADLEPLGEPVDWLIERLRHRPATNIAMVVEEGKRRPVLVESCGAEPIAEGIPRSDPVERREVPKLAGPEIPNTRSSVPFGLIGGRWRISLSCVMSGEAGFHVAAFHNRDPAVR